MRILPLALFFASGVAALVYEVVWIRALSLTLSVTVYALTIVLCTFMAGLGLGAALAARFADRIALLSGGRLASELRDTPVSYSVITREFIDALNLTDLQSAADWTTGGTYAYDIETPMAFGQAVNYSTRGSGAGTQQRNFFPQRNNLDSYNLERYDFGRGPNAILFGNGSLGGDGFN